jgi:hypothetical protein
MTDLGFDLAELTSRIRGLPGIRVVFPARRLPALVSGVRQVGRGPEAGIPLRIEHAGDIVRITAVIGIDHASPAPEVAAAVYEELHAALSAAGVGSHEIAVRVAHVD